MKVSTILTFFAGAALVLSSAGCTPAGTTPDTTDLISSPAPLETAATGVCPVTPAVIAQPEPDAAVQGTLAPGAYIISENRAIWVGAWWTTAEDSVITDDPDGVKIGWFRPAGETLTISGRRLDAPALPLTAEVPCCYPTRFQPSGLFFPTPGCWEVTGQAGDDTLTFVLQVDAAQGKR